MTIPTSAATKTMLPTMPLAGAALTNGRDARRDWNWAHHRHTLALSHRDRAYADVDARTGGEDDPYWTAISEALCDEACEAESYLIVTPAPDLAALRVKLEHAFGGQNSEGREWTLAECETVLADVRRLLASGDGSATH